MAYHTPLTALAKLNAATSFDPGQLLSIASFFSPHMHAPALTLTLLAYKHGLTLPKDESLCTHTALSKLIQNSLKKNGCIIDTKQEISALNWDKKRLQEISTKSGETFVAKAIIDATHVSLGPSWPKNDLGLSITNNNSTLNLKVYIHNEAVSEAMPRCGFFYCSHANSPILCHYQIVSHPARAELSTIPAIAEDDGLAKKKILHLKLISPNNACSAETLMNEANRIIKRYFSHAEMPAEHQEQIKSPMAEDLARGILTDYTNQFRATHSLTPALGINGEFATAYAIFGAIARIFRLKT